MKIKILKPVPGYGYFGGEVTETDDKTGSYFVAIGAAILIPETENLKQIPTIQAVVKGEEVERRLAPKRGRK